MSPDKLSAGSGSGWVGGAEKPPESKQRRAMYERLNCKESVFGKMLANEARQRSSPTKRRCSAYAMCSMIWYH